LATVLKGEKAEKCDSGCRLVWRVDAKDPTFFLQAIIKLGQFQDDSIPMDARTYEFLEGINVYV
jgi:hypothetical protein